MTELPRNSRVLDSISFEKKAYFFNTAYPKPDALWQSDGTPEGTNIVKAFPGRQLHNGFVIDSKTGTPILINGSFFFITDDSLTNGVHHSLWKSDGTKTGTVRLKSIEGPGFNEYVVLGDKFYWFTMQGTLIRSNGTAAGTHRIKKVDVWNYNKLVAFKNKIYFTASDPEHDKELWVSDGTAAGTKLFKDILTFDLEYEYECNDGETCYSYSSSSFPGNLFVHKDNLFFNANDGINGHRIWKSDGTVSGTKILVSPNSGAPGGGPFQYPVSLGETILFLGYDETSGLELWKTDGTSSGTVMFRDINPGTDSSSALRDGAVVFNNELYFTTIHDRRGQLWKTDGTKKGTTLIRRGVISHGFDSAVLKDRLYFSGWQSDQDHDELWVTDGTSGGTKLVEDLFPGKNSFDNFNSSSPGNFIALDNFIMFTAFFGTYYESGYNRKKRGLFRLDRITPKNISPILQLLLLGN